MFHKSLEKNAAKRYNNAIPQRIFEHMEDETMRASFSDRFYIAAPQGVAVKLSDMLSSAQIIPSGVVHTGDEAVRAAKDGALLLTTYRLPDMTGEELASRLGEAADVVMIVPQDYEGEEAENVIMLHNPISQDALVQSLKTLAHRRLRMQQLRARAEKLSRTLEERKLIDRAKGKLMDTLHLTESEAHYRSREKRAWIPAGALPTLRGKFWIRQKIWPVKIKKTRRNPFFPSESFGRKRTDFLFLAADARIPGVRSSI